MRIWNSLCLGSPKAPAWSPLAHLKCVLSNLARKRWSRDGNGAGIPCSRRGPTTLRGKIPAPDEDGDRDQSPSGDGDGDGGQCSPRPHPRFPALGDIPSPSPPFHPQLGKSLHPRFFLVDFSWIICVLLNLCCINLSNFNWFWILNFDNIHLRTK